MFVCWVVKILTACVGQTLSWILESDAAGVDASGSALIIVNLVGFVVSLIIASPVFFNLNQYKDQEYDDYVGYVDDSSEKSKEIEASY